MNTIPWFERTFDFSLPPEMFPQLQSRLRGAPARLEETLRGAPPELLVNRSDGRWSPQEHAGHLLDLEALWIARLEDYIEGRAVLTPADLTNRRTHEANHNARPLEDILAAFRVLRDNTLRYVRDRDTAMLSRTLLHPRIKTPMRLLDHLHFIAEHDDQHLSRIEELLAA
ncbi:MAG: DinB family protein [Acidobacteriota bacterium]|nr:DinB family protein [Acidobacteriota bacterium]